MMNCPSIALGQLTTTINGLWTGKKPPFINIAVIRNTNFSKDCRLKMDDVAMIDVEVKQYASRKLQMGDIIIEKSGGSDKQPVGRPVLFNISEGEYSFSNFTSTLRVNDPKTILPEYLHKFLYRFYLSGKTAAVQSKTTGLRNLDFNAYRAIKVPVPSIEEQQHVVDELDLITGIIDNKKAQLRDLDALPQSIFYEMFGDLMVSEKWPRHIIKDLCIVNPSKKLIPSNLQANDTVSFLPMEDLEIKAGYAEPKQTRLLSEVQGSYTFFAEDDVLLAKVTPCFENGKVGIASNLRNGIGFGSSEFFVIRPIKGIVKEVIYFLAQTQHFVSEASKQLTGTSGLRRVPRSFIENLSIAIPPMGLQEAFAERIKVIEKEKITIGKSIQSAQMLLDSMMDAYFG